MQDRLKTAFFLHRDDTTISDRKIELAVEEDLRQAKIKVDLAQAEAKANLALHELQRAAAQAQLDKELKEAKEKMKQEHLIARSNLKALSFLQRLDSSYFLGRGGIVAQDAGTVFLLNTIEGCQRDGGSRAILEQDLIKPEDIFKPRNV